MATLVDYRGLQVVSPEPLPGDGGAAIQADLKNLVDWSPRSVWSESDDPTGAANNSQDFFAGSLWLRTDTNPPRLFICQSATDGSAVWLPVLLTIEQDVSPKLGGDLDVNGHALIGAVQIGAIAADTLNLTASHVTLPSGVTFTKTAETGIAETVLTLRVNDDTSYLRFKSNSSTAANFAPTVEGFHSGANVAYTQQGIITTDTGANPCLSFTARKLGGSKVDVRPVVHFINHTTTVVEITALGNLLVKLGSIGYGTGAGGTVSQSTSKSTGVTLNKSSGQITLNNAALAADTTVSFTLTNSAIAAVDVLVMNHISGGTAGSYVLNAQCAAGSASINVRNITAGSLSEAIVIQFVLIKGATS